jgi:hypothetical protein
LDNPDEFLDRMVKVEFQLVTGTADRFISSELELSNQILVWVLGHSATFLCVQKYIIYIKGCCNKGLIVSDGSWNRTTLSILVSTIDRRTTVAVEGSNSP